MKTHVKYGLIGGGIGFVLNIPIAAFMGICGPIVSIAAGGISGFMSSYNSKETQKREGTQAGAIAGGIAGALTLVGQLIGATLVLIFVHQSGMPMGIGEVPALNAPAWEKTVYYGFGIGTGFCIGLAGAILSAIAGSIGGRLGVREVVAEEEKKTGTTENLS